MSVHLVGTGWIDHFRRALQGAEGGARGSADRVLRERWEARPHEAAMSGLHDYDGRLPPVTPESIADRVAQIVDAAVRPAVALLHLGPENHGVRSLR